MGRRPGPQISDADLRDLVRRACRERAGLGLPRPTIEELRALAWPAFIQVDRMCRIVCGLREAGEIPDERQGSARWDLTRVTVERAIERAAAEQAARREPMPEPEPTFTETIVAEHMARERRIRRPLRQWSVVSGQWSDRMAPPGDRSDLKTEN